MPAALPLAILIVSGVVYQLAMKASGAASPWRMLAVAYGSAFAVTIVLTLANHGEGRWWPTRRETVAGLLIGLAALGIEAGTVFIYRAGWRLANVSIISNLSITVVLAIIGITLFGEHLTAGRAAGSRSLPVGPLSSSEAEETCLDSRYRKYGPGPVTEDAPLTETYNDYSRGKVVCERLLAETARLAARCDHVSLRAPHIWGPHPTARKRLVVARLERHEPIVLPGIEAAEWAQYCDAWVDARDLAAIVAECVARPPGVPLNVVTGHFAWHDLYSELIRLTGSRSALVHRALDAITDDELPRKHLHAQTSRFSEARLADRLGPIPRRAFDVTLRDTVLSSEQNLSVEAQRHHRPSGCDFAALNLDANEDGHRPGSSLE